MIEKLIKAGAIVLAAAMLAACGGGSEPETEKGIERGESGSATAAAAPTKTPETEPARAQRLDHLLPLPHRQAGRRSGQVEGKSHRRDGDEGRGKTNAGQRARRDAERGDAGQSQLEHLGSGTREPADQRPGTAAGHLRANRPGTVRTGPGRNPSRS